MGVKIHREDTDSFKVTVVDTTNDNEPSIYDLRYLVYRLDIQRKYKLGDLETKIISFMLSYANV